MVRIAHAPCSWGVIEGIDGDRDGYRLVLDEMQETGCIGTELGDWGFMPTDPGALRSEFDSRGLALIASWVSANLHDAACHRESADDAVRTGRQLAKVGGANTLVALGWDGPTSVGHGVFCELGKGCVGFPGVLAALSDIGYDGGFIVEQHVLPGTGTPRESAHRNREYVRSIGV